MQYLISSLTIALIVSIYFLFRKFFEKHISKVYKITSILLAVIFFVRYFLAGESKLEGILNFSYNNIYSSSFLCFVSSILVWLGIIANITLWLVGFFDFKILKNYGKTFCLVVSVLQFCFLNQYIMASTGTTALTWTGALMAIEVGIMIVYSTKLMISNNFFKISKREIVEMVVALPLALLFSIPPYLPQVMFGNLGSPATISFSLTHRLYLYLSVLIVVWVFFVLRRKDKEFNRMALLFLSLASMIGFCHHYTFEIFISPTDWPLHLCNTVMFIIPLCLIFKWEKLFYFTMFINVIGSLFAMFMPGYESTGIFAPSVVRFWINHIQAFAMPIIIILLRVYPRPKLKQFMYSMLFFVIYFVLILVINAWFTNYDNGVDFFFLNSDFVVDKLGQWAENTRNATLAFNIGKLKFVFYPLYQFLFFIVYNCFGLAMWFLYAMVFQVQDFYDMMYEKDRKIKQDEIMLLEQYNKKEVGDCMNEESKDKLVVKNFYKKYGNNKEFAVKDINFVVNSGEVLGFLGPNGAGKSTTIKCIVGIQPPTKGSIEINGYDIEKQPVQAKLQFGFVPDHYALYENLSGREYVNYIADLYGVSKEDRDSRLKKLCKDLNMEEAFDNQIRTYSHGMKQKITVISAFVHDPKLCILDEPLTGLDPISIYQVKECMKEHAKKGNIVFFSSHIIDIVEKICDRVIILNNHQIEADITLKELKEKNISLEKYYLDIIGQNIEE